MARQYRSVESPDYAIRSKYCDTNGQDIDFGEITAVTHNENGMHLTYKNGSKLIIPIISDGSVSITVANKKVKLGINRNMYTITETLSHCIAVNNPTIVFPSSDIPFALVYEADEGYEMPDAVTLTGATGEWVLNAAKTTGTLTISAVTSAIAVSVTATEIETVEESEPQ